MSSSDLSWNDMCRLGLDAIGKAMAMGALHSPQRLNSINCTAIKALPDSLEELLELDDDPMLDGCVQLRTLPQGVEARVAQQVADYQPLRALDDGEFKHLPSSTKIIKTKEEKARRYRGEEEIGGGVVRERDVEESGRTDSDGVLGELLIWAI